MSRSQRLQNFRERRGVRSAQRLAFLALLTVGILSLTGVPAAHAAPSSTTGFALPFSGAPAFEYVAPTKLTRPGQLNQPLGQKAADAIAARIGLHRNDALSEKQSRDLVSGRGAGGNRQAAKTIDASILILTNTVGRPMLSKIDGQVTKSVLGSYGVYVNTRGQLQSPANADAPTRQVNTLIAPGGYVGQWLRANGATHTLAALYRSAYTVEVPFGFVAQQISGTAQLVTNTKGGVKSTVGMSMAPPLWIVNFALIYIVSPRLAAAMPAYWTPIPPVVARAIEASPTGQVPYARYQKYFR
ncbi:hypothetical protein [Gordonia sp. (in: high G+C Gram-positive bacteria)]|uniref:hypothetical protein n=1 Tax=Gordonia sp. (in: high G+C Gram-positive bacteria) TaxID=84139 RepID=UPI003C776089